MLSLRMHCIRFCILATPIFLLTGCWQKIEYKAARADESHPHSTAQVTPAPPATDHRYESTTPPVASTATSPIAPSQDFPDALAASTTSTSPAAAASDPKPATEPAPLPKAPAIASGGDNRYAAPPKTADVTLLPAAPSIDMPNPSLAADDPTKRHTDATPVSATVDASTSTEADIRRAAWILGSRLSLAALAHDRGMAANNVPGWFDEARGAAKVLGANLPELPAAAAPDDTSLASTQVIDYLLTQGQRIGRELSKQNRPQDAALLEVALKSNLLLLLYSPGSDAAQSLSASISTAAPQARLPSPLWKPVMEQMDKRASLGDVRNAVRQMHADIDRYLASNSESASR